ncbi:MAG: hypothetical protein IIC67_09090 [Thaumarchaeota archaeon]|nr:hypothetical protein [Nitrososphaerota archaeon]
MLLTKAAEVVHQAITGNEYTISIKKDTTPIPKRFYCHWKLPSDEIQYDENHKEIIDDYENGQCCFNHRVGLPTRKWESDAGKVEVIVVELTHFNRRMMQNYFKHRKYSKNKCRGDGTTEIKTVRWNIFKYGILDNVKNRKGVIMPGTSSKLTNEISTRIKAICDKIPQIYMGGIPNSIAPVKFHFKTGGRLELTSATPDADRGYENVGDIDQEEVAHWDMVDDKPVYYASEGVHDKTRCHIGHNTTPRGKDNFYYELIWAPEATSDFFKHIVNWREVVGLPVEKIEDLYGLGFIDDEMLIKLRKDLVKKYHTDPAYKEWYDTFKKSEVLVFWDNGELIPIEEMVDIPIPILDINAIVSDSQTERSHYDQELDNEFISGENKAIGEFQEADLKADDLRMQIQKYNEGTLEDSEFRPENFE